MAEQSASDKREQKAAEQEVSEQSDTEQSDTEQNASEKASQKAFVMSRRELCAGAAAAAVMIGVGGIKVVAPQSLIRPPGGQDEDRLLAGCIRCEKCYEVCPRDVIKPAHIENGILNMRTPTFDFSENYCDFCTQEHNGIPLCAKSCPTSALQIPQDISSVIIGKAKITEDYCLAYHALGCRFCHDACPYEAITLDEQNRPVVVSDRCNGCGACESVCVAMESGSLSLGAKTRAILIYPTEQVHE